MEEQRKSSLNRRFFRIETLNLFKAVLFPLLILGIAVGILNTKRMNEEIDSSYQSKLNYTSERMATLSEDIERLISSLTTNPAVTVRLKSSLQHAAETQTGIRENDYAVYNAIMDLTLATVRRNPYIESYYIYFEAGGDYFITNDKRLSRISDYEDREWYEDYEGQKAFVNSWSKTRKVSRGGEEKDILTVYTRIFAAGTGSDRGVLVLNIDRTALNELLDNLDSDKKLAVCVADSSGNVLFGNHTYTSRYGESLPGYFTYTSDSRQEVYRKSSGGIQYSCSDLALEAFNWHVASFIAITDLYAASIEIVLALFFILIVVMLFSVVYAYRTAKQNSRDIAGLEQSIRQAREGIFEDRGAQYSPYGTALMDLVYAFLDKEYRDVRLADRRHHMKLLELQALQAQLNPHFLFNTMTTIQWKAIGLTGGSNAASEMLENLSDILHYVLDNGTAPARVDEELMITDSYVAIQKIRYANEFEYKVECDEHLYDLRIMRMILQPLVENCIHHGFRNDGTVLHVSVAIRKQGDFLNIQVTDDGLGMNEERLAEVEEGMAGKRDASGRHIGLYNVNKRIALIYGEQYGIRIESREGKKTKIEIKIPCTEEE